MGTRHSQFSTREQVHAQWERVDVSAKNPGWKLPFSLCDRPVFMEPLAAPTPLGAIGNAKEGSVVAAAGLGVWNLCVGKEVAGRRLARAREPRRWVAVSTEVLVH